VRFHARPALRTREIITPLRTENSTEVMHENAGTATARSSRRTDAI
jgi:hypothetical protein